MDTCAIVGNSMVNGIDKKRLSQKHDKFFPFLGARIEDTNQYLIPVRKEQPDYLILIVGYIYIYMIFNVV